jgi:predicted metalloprotease with PDZ domain
MLIAFLTDLKILSRSGGKRDVSELLRSLYEKYRDPKNEADGNQVVTTMIGDAEIRQSIENGETINWASALKAFGIEREERAGSVLLRVTSKPSGSQKKLLDRLGYNNWRNSSVGPK